MADNSIDTMTKQLGCMQKQLDWAAKATIEINEKSMNLQRQIEAVKSEEMKTKELLQKVLKVR